MAATGDRNDPFLAFRFSIELNGLAVGGFSECSGLQLETDVIDYAEGGLNTHLHKFPGRTKQSNVTLKRGIVDWDLWSWYFALTQGQIMRLDATICVFDPSGSDAVLKWRLSQAFPVKWIGPELNGTQNSVAVETLELCHIGLFRQL